MIKKLRLKFIILAMVAVFVLLGIIVAGMNVVNYQAVLKDAEDTLMVLARNKGAIPDFGKQDGMPPEPDMNKNGQQTDGQTDGQTSGQTDSASESDQMNPGDSGGGPGMPDDGKFSKSDESLYESRFFSVLLDEDGTVLTTDTRKIVSVSEDQANAYAEEIMKTGREQGFVDEYMFVKKVDEDGIRITFLDCGRKMGSFRTFLFTSLIAAAVGYLIFFFVIFVYSKKIIRPVAESYEKQKRFITDAGHEIKTPLAIIKADADVLEMDYENNEWIEDIQKQTERLSALTNDLVSLARMEEAVDPAAMEETPLSDIAEEEAGAYLMMAQAADKELDIQVQPAVFVKGNEKSLRRLVNILMDNALKYSPEHTDVSLVLKKTGRSVLLSVSNESTEPIQKESLNLLFDRFYRTDSSRNSETGGHGIGLSMAKAIAESHGGKIAALSADGKHLTIEVTLPVS